MSKGIIREIDDLGRVVIPISFRRSLDINKGDHVEVFVENGVVKIKKVERECMFCGCETDIFEYRGKMICKKCAKEIIK